ncbi:hypothetical protein LN572_12235, partial [Xanthomonas citri pv. fuscans]
MSGGSASLSLVEGGSSVQDRPDLGLQGLVLLAQFHGVAADAVQLAHGFGRGGEPFDETTLLLAAKQLGL